MGSAANAAMVRRWRADRRRRQIHQRVLSWRRNHGTDQGMIRFTVFGTPVPQGSSRAFFVKKLGRSVITSANPKLKPWRKTISDVAKALDQPILSGAISVSVKFFFTRPKSAPKKRTA